MTAQPISVEKNATVDFSAVTVSGEVLYFADKNALVIMNDEHGGMERLSVNLEVYGLTPKPGHVFIKDWSEGRGVAASLADAGLIEITEQYAVGQFASTAYEARVIL
jgi:predicted GNAT family acetyltransferase